jgi:hypothetical protein
MTEKKTKTTAIEDKPVVAIKNQFIIEDETAIQAAPPKNKGGRPSKYNEDVTNRICIRLSLGESLKQICKDADMPSQAVVYEWLQKYPEFLDIYTRAREEQAETHADEIVSIADETPALLEIKDEKGNVVDIKLDSAYIQWQRQRIDARKWNAAKQRPKKYGDRVQHEGDDKNPIVIETHVNVFGELLKNLKMERQLQIHNKS